MFEQVGIVGVGLIGASIGRALRARGLAKRIIGIGRSRETLHKAEELGAIDLGCTWVGEELSEVEFLVIATPLPIIAPTVAEAREVLPATAIITDAGSTKKSVLESVARLPEASHPVAAFVGSHPMAGSHRHGPDASHQDLFVNHPCIVIDSPPARPAEVETVEAFWQALGMRVIRMAADQHDQQVAWISHLPHVLSFALARSVERSSLELAGPGFRDTTRLAASSPTLWTEIFHANRDAILRTAQGFRHEFDALIDLIERQDWQTLENALTDANHIIHRLGDRTHPPKP